MKNKRSDFLGTIEKRHDLLEGSAKFNLWAMLFVAAVSFAIMYFLNCLTPFAADDFNYHFIYWDNCSIATRITSLSDIFTSMVYHYKAVNGRVLLHSIVELFMLWGKPVFNFANAAMYVLLTLLIYKHCRGSEKGNRDVRLFVLINIMLWLFVKSWGQTLLWADGSVNYLWGSVIRLAALLPFRLYADRGEHPKNKWYFVLPAFICCAVAGATNENTGAAFVGMTALFIIYYKIKGKKLPLWSFSGLAGAACGFIFMVSAPANFIRNAEWAAEGNSLLQRAVNIPANAVLYLAAPAAIYAAAAYLLHTVGKKKTENRLLLSFIYILGAFGGTFSMLATPYFPTRTWFGVTVMMIVAAGSLIGRMRFSPEALRRSMSIVAVFCCLWCGMSLVKTVEDAASVKQQYDTREEKIAAEKASGNYDVIIKKITPENEHSPLYGVGDVNTESSENWGNQSKAAYYGLKSVIGEE